MKHRLSCVMARHKRGWCLTCNTTVRLQVSVNGTLCCRAPVRRLGTHVITSVDETTKTGTCAWCGKVSVSLRTDSGRWRCDNSQGAWKHGLTRHEAREYVKDKVCEICGSSQNLRVDHDYVSGRIRGALCNTCNTSIGQFKEDPKLFTAAIEYLKRSAQ